MIPTKLWGYIGVGAAGLALIGLVLWQMNSLMKKGVALGKAEAEIEKRDERIVELEEAIVEERGEFTGKVDSLNTIIENCKFDLSEQLRLGGLYREEIDRLKLRPPVRETVVLESTNCTDGLAEAHMKAIQHMEGRREEVPYP